MNNNVIRAGTVGLLLSAGLMITGGGFSIIPVGRLVVMAALVYLASIGKRWAAWLISFWFMLLGLVVLSGILRGTNLLGSIIVGLVATILIASGVIILRIQKKSALP